MLTVSTSTRTYPPIVESCCLFSGFRVLVLSYAAGPGASLLNSPGPVVPWSRPPSSTYGGRQVCNV